MANTLMTQIFSLLLFALSLATGQIFFKFVAQTSEPLNSLNNILMLVTNAWFHAALVCYGMSTILWIYILQKVPLSFAYPFVAIGFILVPLFAWLIFGEVLKLKYFLGVLFIIIGLLTISFTGR